MFAAERMKLRRSMVWWVVVLLPSLAVASGGANYWLQTTNGALETGWDVLTGQITLFYAMMFFSTGVALLGAAVWRPEHRGSSWNRILTTGRSPVSLVLMKSVMILLLVVLVQVMFVGLSWGSGLLLGLRGAPPSSFLAAAALCVPVCAPLVLLQSLMSMLMRSFAAPVAICLAGCMIGFATAASGAGTGPLDLLIPQAVITRTVLLGSAAVASGGGQGLDEVFPLVCSAAGLIVVMVVVTVLVVRRRPVVSQ
ncbi:ABC transporter permease [[Pseudopropionibacterium] massiliense]|uniref:ABC transporter permease n=1 Tax=[Pseudopropionibacterium] massiliense TaxID=2220000 RepID=UPI0010325869|nr:ABC transporter permease [[Pseudopropionibacterium] massiliense]